MNCPDINRYLDARDAGPLPADLEAHLEACPDCRALVELVDRLPSLLEPAPAVPDGLVRAAVQRVMAARQAEARRARRFHVVAAGVLMALSALGVLLFTGSGPGGGPSGLVLAALGAGVVGALVRWWRERTRDPRWLDFPPPPPGA